MAEKTAGAPKGLPPMLEVMRQHRGANLSLGAPLLRFRERTKRNLGEQERHELKTGDTIYFPVRRRRKQWPSPLPKTAKPRIHRVEVKPFGVERPADPRQELLVPLMGWV